MKLDIKRLYVRMVKVFASALFLTFGVGLQAQGQATSFDHLKTGFALTGAHTSVRCESCHSGGVLRGTPRDCATCHTSGLRLARNNVVKPQQHLPSQLGCETCHTTQSFSGAKFSHAGVVAGTCSTCHNGTVATGKSSTHLPTQSACDSCHKTTANWSGAKPDHSTFTTASNCASCHNGTNATGKNGIHIPTCLLYTSPSPRDRQKSRMPSSA